MKQRGYFTVLKRITFISNGQVPRPLALGRLFSFVFFFFFLIQHFTNKLEFIESFENQGILVKKPLHHF